MERSTSTPVRSSSSSHQARAIQLLSKITHNRIELYKPYPKQIEFHTLGRHKPERCLLAGNQLGKTTCGTAEDSYHLTGRYPDWWDGHRFEKPIRMWVAGPTARKVRDVLQRKLVGKRGRWGELSMIPKSAIWDKPIMHPNVSGLIDTIEIKHSSGGLSSLQFLSYDMEDDAWASDTLHVLHCDEEPPGSKWNEGLARLTATAGIAYITTTPLQGMTEVIRHFYPRADAPHRGMVRMGLKDAPHLTDEMQERILKQYPSHERKARTEGIPILGSGQIYALPEEALCIPPFKVPEHFARICGIDLGGGVHPFAAVLLAHDRDTETTFVYDAYKSLDSKLSTHAHALKRRGCNRIPVAWPHDANITGRDDDAITYAQRLKREGLRMLPRHSTHEDGSSSVWPGIQDLQQAMADGRFRVFDHLVDWLDEYRTYHLKNGRIVKEHDDLMDATRYGFMMVHRAQAVLDREKRPTFGVTVGMDWDPKRGV